MKIFYLTIIFSVISSLASAFECPPNQDTAQDDIETLYKNAENVLFLHITKGELLKTHISYKATVVETLKGTPIREIELTDKAFISPRNITMGNYYIIYLYGSTEIDFCTPIIDLWNHVSDMEKLIQHSEREDIGDAEAIRRTIELSNIEI